MGAGPVLLSPLRHSGILILASCHCLGTGILLAHGLGQVTRSLDFDDLNYVFFSSVLIGYKKTQLLLVKFL